MHSIYLTTICLLLFFSLSSCEVCKRLIVDGISDQQIAGVYYYRRQWEGRPAYQSECGSLQLYFYQRDSVAYWLIGPVLGKPSGYVLVHDTSKDPSTIGTSWKEYSAMSASWEQSTLKVTCEEECVYLDVENDHLSTALKGPYKFINNPGVPSFKHFSQDIYIHANQARSNCSSWHFGDDLTGSYSYLYSFEESLYPNSIRNWYVTKANAEKELLHLKWTCLSSDEYFALAAKRGYIPSSSTAKPEQQTITSPNQVCGERQVSMGAAMILNGDNVVEGKWPFMVALLHPEGDVKCGGILLNSKWVLTAGHCISETTVGGETVMVGTLDTDAPGMPERVFGIKRAIQHPDFEWLTNSDFQLIDDLGLLELSETVVMGTYVQPVCLQKADQFLGLPGTSSNTIGFSDFDNCFTAGWGEKEYKGEVGGVLQDFHVKTFIEKSECAETYFRSYADWVPQSETICVQNTQKSRICRGDSGSPLMCHSNGRWYVTGVASWSLTQCIPWKTNYPSMYTTISPYRDWILQTISS